MGLKRHKVHAARHISKISAQARWLLKCDALAWTLCLDNSMLDNTYWIMHTIWSVYNAKLSYFYCCVSIGHPQKIFSFVGVCVNKAILFFCGHCNYKFVLFPSLVSKKTVIFIILQDPQRKDFFFFSGQYQLFL